MTRWQRPPGPLNVWKTLDGFETLNDGTKKPTKFSIQDVPKNDQRRKEVLDHLYEYFLAAEPLSKSMNIKQDPEGVKDFQTFWEYGLDQDVAVGCYKLDTEGKIAELVGVNVLFIITDETIKDFSKIKNNMKSSNFKKIWRLFEKFSEQIDVFKDCNVNKYIGSISLSVAPNYQGQKLGFHILNAREAMAKKYGLTVTCTMFTAKSSQLQAQRVGFEDVCTIYYEDFLDKNGHREFSSSIEPNFAKMMLKKFK